MSSKRFCRLWRNFSRILLVIGTSPLACASAEVYRISTKARASEAEILSEAEKAQVIILSEVHSFVSAPNDSVQEDIADFLRTWSSSRTGGYVMAWEFLSFSEQSAFQEDWQRLSRREYLDRYTGSATSLSYARVLEVAQQAGASFWALNLPSGEKKKVSRGGRSMLTKEFLPLQSFPISPRYEFRLREAFAPMLNSHGQGQLKIENLIESQWLVDEIMAERILQKSSQSPLVALIGSFHTDEFDGVVRSLLLREPSLKILVLRWTRKSLGDPRELLEHKPPLADYLWILD
ncbi:MAG: ChaN family lipoprotein [Bdellovibrio sp.]